MYIFIDRASVDCIHTASTAFLLEHPASHSFILARDFDIMDAQWQQFYWQHSLLQQQQQQQQQQTTHQGQATHQYTPTGTYGPMTHSVRTQQAHHNHPYTPSPSAYSSPNSRSHHHLHRHTAAPTTPTATSFKHSPAHSAPPAPPSTVPFPKPPLQDSWRSTDSHWDSNSLHGHQLHRTIQPTQWSRRVGIDGLPTFDVFPWLLAYRYGRLYGQDSQPREVLWPHPNTQHSRVRLHHPPITRNSGLDAIAEALHTSQGTEVPNKTTQARAFHAPLISLLAQQLQAHTPAAAEGSALRALKATSDDLARAPAIQQWMRIFDPAIREKLQAHGIELTPRKEAGRSSAPSAPAAPAEPAAHNDPNNGANACDTFRFCLTLTTTTTSSPPTQFTSNSTSTPSLHNVVTTNMATTMRAPLPLAYHIENTIAEPSSNNFKTTSQSPLNYPCATGIHMTTFTTSLPSSSLPTTLRASMDQRTPLHLQLDATPQLAFHLPTS